MEIMIKALFNILLYILHIINLFIPVFRIRVFFPDPDQTFFSESRSGSAKNPDPIRKNPDPDP